VKEPESFMQLSLPQIEIPFRDMASIVTEAEAAIVHRFEVLEPQIYNSNARQVPKSPEWFMSASSKIKVIAKNMTKVALVAEEVARFNFFDLQTLGQSNLSQKHGFPTTVAFRCDGNFHLLHFFKLMKRQKTSQNLML
jgi:hypothetical protein